MSHLTQEELVRWLERGLDADRHRVTEHLAVCERCASACAGLLERPVQGEPEQLRPEAFVPTGYRAFRARSSQPRSRWLWLGLPLTAATAALAAVLVGPASWRRAPPAPTETELDTRRGGAELEALSPVGAVEGAAAFRWNGAETPGRYLVEVFDADRRRIFAATVNDATELAWPVELTDRLDPETAYAWMVTLLDSRGQAVRSSAVVSFSIPSAR